MNQIPVTVVIPTYNRPDLTRRAIASVLAQRPAAAAEVIVVDDGSSDDTAEVAQASGARVIRHEHNRGLAAARNTGIAAATHGWVALLDSDDEWLSHHLDLLWSERGDHVLVGSSILHVGHDPRKNRVTGPVFNSRTVFRTPAPHVFPGNILGPSGVMVRRDAVLEVGGFRAHFGVVEDLALWLRVLEVGTGVISPRVSVLYHEHDEQMSGDYQRMFQGALATIDEHRAKAWCSTAVRERWRGRMAWDYMRLALRHGERRQALREAATLLGHPQRLIGLPVVFVQRFLGRRRGRVAVTSLPTSQGRPCDFRALA
jgi:glycosyltransferase involved in cell wall biosynthesis